MASSRELPIGTVTFLLTDVQGSTDLLKELGDSYTDVIEDHHRLIRRAAADGVEVRAAGDGFIWAFTDGSRALGVAIEMQRLLTSHTWPHGAQVLVRMSLHIGEAKVVVDDYVSVALHQSVRLNGAAHGGQIIASASFREHVGERLPEFAGLTSCGSFVVRDFDGPVEIFEVRHPDLPADFPPPRVPSAAVHNLSPNRTSFVGRHFDVGEVTKLLDIAGVVSLVGPGGIGKTRLACEVGRAVAGRHEGGVWFIGLQGMGDPASLLQTISRNLGIAEDPATTPEEAIIERLAGTSSLLILDNCEHVIDAVAGTVSDLVDACPALSVLATSREPLAIAAEHVFRVDPLPVPADGEPSADATACASVELFVQRARQAKRDFSLVGEDIGAVFDICRLLDGIPLALELVAARAGASSVGELADALRGSGALDASRRGGDVRHRTIRSTIAWSYDRLSPDAQIAFRTLAVFRGGFTTDSATAVISSTGRDIDVQAVLYELVARSICESQPDHDQPRFRLLEPIRQFAADVLGSETKGAEAAHSEWIAGFCAQGDDGLRGPQQGPWLDRLDAELDNIRAAFDRALERRDGSGAARIAVGSQSFCLYRGYRREAIDRCTRALTLELTGEERAHVLHSRGQLLLPMGEIERAESDLNEVLLYDAVGVPDLTISALAGLAQAAYFKGDFPEARLRYGRVIEESRAAGNSELLAQGLADAGNLAISANDLKTARAYTQEALDLYLSLGGGPPAVSCMLILAQVDGLVGDREMSKRRHEDALQLAIDRGYDGGRAGAELGLSWIVMREGDVRRAAELATSARDLFDRLGDDRHAATAAMYLAQIATVNEDLALAVSEHCDAIDRAMSAGAVDVVQRVLYLLGRALCTTADAAIGVRLLAAARRLADGGLLAWDQAEHAIGLEAPLAAARSSLGPRFDEAWQLGLDAGVDDAIALIRTLVS